MSNILNLLSFDGFISVNKNLIRKLGLEEACVVGFLATMHEYHANKDPDGWFYVKHDLTDQDEDLDKNRRNTAKYQLGMKRDKFITITKKLEENGIIITERRGIPALKFYMFNADVIYQLLTDENAVEPVNKGTRSDVGKHDILLSENTKSSCRKTRNLYKEKINKKESISPAKKSKSKSKLPTLAQIKKECEREEYYIDEEKFFKWCQKHRTLNNPWETILMGWSVENQLSPTQISAKIKEKDINPEVIIKSRLANFERIISGSFEVSNGVKILSDWKMEYFEIKEKGKVTYSYDNKNFLQEWKSTIERLADNGVEFKEI